MKKLHAIERIIIVELMSRAALYAVLLANAVKARWVLAQWMDDLTAGFLAGGVELVLMIGIHMVTDRRVYNVTKARKTDPDKVIGAPLVGAVAFFGFLSAVANVAYLVDHGAGWLYGVLFGVAAPFAAAFVAYLIGDEAAVERRLAEFEEARQQRKTKTRAPRTKAGQRPDKVHPAPTPQGADNGQIRRDLGELPENTQAQIRRVVRYHGENPHASLEDLSGLLDVSRSRAGDVRRYAVECGMLEKHGRRNYTPVNGGSHEV